MAKSLGGGFVPLQMISLGGRMLNVVGENGPLASKASNAANRSKLLRISAAVGVARSEMKRKREGNVGGIMRK